MGDLCGQHIGRRARQPHSSKARMMYNATEECRRGVWEGCEDDEVE
jgi:hypothetical protein